MTKKALITGGTSGIGLKIAETLEECGYSVFTTGRRKLDKKNHLSCDFSKPENIINVYNCTKNELGCVDILINNAGQYLYSPIESMDFNKIIELFNLNFLSHYYLTSLVVNDMKKNKFGRIINIASISGVVGEAYASLYAASKSAYFGFTKSLALELASYNITVNSISPGWVKTPLTDEALSEEEKNETLEIIPEHRFIEPIEIANLVKYLISDDAKGVTGQNINLCAGLTCGC